MYNLFKLMRGILTGALLTMVLFGLLPSTVDVLFAADKTQRVRDARLGEQDRSLAPDPSRFEGYDNSDFLRDMDDIARGTYIEPRKGGKEAGEQEGVESEENEAEVSESETIE